VASRDGWVASAIDKIARQQVSEACYSLAS
jgi:hypothetical protein